MASEKFTKKDISLGRKIARIRRQKGLTQEDVHGMTGISMTTISLLEVGKRRVSLRLLQKIANALGTKVQELIPY